MAAKEDGLFTHWDSAGERVSASNVKKINNLLFDRSKHQSGSVANYSGFFIKLCNFCKHRIKYSSMVLNKANRISGNKRAAISKVLQKNHKVKIP